MDPTATGMEQRPSAHVGLLLRAMRERLGESIDSAAAALRIRPSFLEDIEAGRFERLPSGAYSIGFVRAYAEHLGLHADEIVRRFKIESRKTTAAAKLAGFPEPASEGKKPAGRLITLALVLAIGAYGAWYWVSNLERTDQDMIEEVPDHLSSLLDDQAGPSSDPTLPTTPIPGAVNGGGGDESAGTALPDADPAAPASQITGFAPPAPVPDQTSGDPSEANAANPTDSGSGLGSETQTPTSLEALGDPVPSEALPGNFVFQEPRIVLRAARESWIELRQGNKQVVRRFLREGDVFLVPDGSNITLTVSNAGGLEVYVDGARTPALGPLGGSRENISLDPESLKTGP